MRQRGLLCPAHSCCPATLAKAASLYLLPLLFYHSLLCPTLLTAIIVCFLCGCDFRIAIVLHSVLSLPSFPPLFSWCPRPPVSLPSPLCSLLIYSFALFTQTHLSHKCTHSPAGDAWQHCVYICLCDGLDDPLLNYSVSPPPHPAAQA